VAVARIEPPLPALLGDFGRAIASDNSAYFAIGADEELSDEGGGAVYVYALESLEETIFENHFE
jgi:hypothetical protein